MISLLFVCVALPVLAWSDEVDVKMSLVCDTECVQEPHGNDYLGTRSKTISGLTCQRWDSQFPHQHDRNNVTKFPMAVYNEENYCRNPDHYNGVGPWCYTTDPNVRYELCGIPLCRDCKPSELGVDYRGTRGVTASGRICQRWDSQEPHAHPYNDVSQFPDAIHNKENFCRNPDHGQFGPWCITTDPDKKWEVCDLPRCADCRKTLGGVEYDGTRSWTISGRTCQRWDVQTPHRSDRNNVTRWPDAIYNEENYCRNSDYDDLSGPWCMTVDPNVRWESCGIPFCPGYPEPATN